MRNRPAVIFLLSLILSQTGCLITDSEQQTRTATEQKTGSTIPTSTLQLSPTNTLPMLTSLGKDRQGFEWAKDSRGTLMVLIPPGEFTMGLTTEQAQKLCLIDVVPGEPSGCEPTEWRGTYGAHSVSLTHAYWMDMYEVTNSEFEACVSAGICQEPRQVGDPYYGQLEYRNYPVDGVSFDNAVTFCEVWRGGRLPTEAEWEYAARGTDGRLWPWATIQYEWEAKRFMNYHWHGMGIVGNPFMPVDSYMLGVSPFGIYNMAGNISEWVMDWYAPYPNEPVVDPSGPAIGTYRLARGGSSGDTLGGANAFARDPADPLRPVSYRGFRCVKDVSSS